jgi:hypothetical protein
LTYYVALGAIVALFGLFLLSAAQDLGTTLFGFGVLAALFLVKRHYDHMDGSARP